MVFYKCIILSAILLGFALSETHQYRKLLDDRQTDDNVDIQVNQGQYSQHPSSYGSYGAPDQYPSNSGGYPGYEPLRHQQMVNPYAAAPLQEPNVVIPYNGFSDVNHPTLQRSAAVPNQGPVGVPFHGFISTLPFGVPIQGSYGFPGHGTYGVPFQGSIGVPVHGMQQQYQESGHPSRANYPSHNVYYKKKPVDNGVADRTTDAPDTTPTITRA